MIIRQIAYPRAGLIGNPSDGYFGRTIAFTFQNFQAQVEVWESPELELLPSRRDHSVFQSLAALHDDVKTHGYYGGFRLLKATAKAFFDFCQERGYVLDNRNFTLRYSSDIPNRVGLAGSSAIIVACAKAIMEFYGVKISRHSLANLALSVENEELAIPAGLQDRVAQCYGGLVFMDFRKETMEERGFGDYEELDISLLPSTYIAYRDDLSEGTEVFHNDLRARWLRGDQEVIEAMRFWAQLTTDFRAALEAGDLTALNEMINANFDKRASLYDVGKGNLDMVRTARSVGASAKFAGSGGAIVGFYEGDEMLHALEASFANKGIRVIRPILEGRH